ncbi:hypothetical protein I8748_05645 [Nostoc sp. CENA67]|uniref:Uncharacterized protein n=1 Tax=Amazonocrinis nigriterrae CENA67 TaxID=2794033 RepID=A0A8J7HL63_9NOST|nr:hypothetical protein [Amazonocrinis nigriterrae]MBH8561667.1 hypothetical protein [Amazonocrinis nigriterrae CENA67]
MDSPENRTSQVLSFYLHRSEDEQEDFILFQLQQRYGLALEGLSKMEKVYLITLLGSNLLTVEAGRLKGFRTEIFAIAGRLVHELLAEEQEKLLAALIDGVIYQK